MLLKGFGLYRLVWQEVTPNFHFQGQSQTFRTAPILTFPMIIGSPGPHKVGQSEIGRGEQRSGGLRYTYFARISIFHKLVKIGPIWLKNTSIL